MSSAAGGEPELGSRLDQLDVERWTRSPHRDHGPRIPTQVLDLARLGLAEGYDSLAVPDEPQRDEMRAAIRANRAQPQHWVGPQRGGG